jgi:hypothetical protein
MHERWKDNMSTDYGIHCLDCKKSIIIDGMREYYVEDVLKNIPILAVLHNTLMSTKGGLDIYVSSSGCDDFTDLIEFIEEHATHHITVIDEYKNIDEKKYGVVFEKSIFDKLMDEYIATLLHWDYEEYYTTSYGLAENVFPDFKKWLIERDLKIKTQRKKDYEEFLNS